MSAIIRIDQVTQVFEENTQKVNALEGVSIQVDTGEFVCLSGPSGSGKSTLLNLIGCLAKPTKGKVWIEKTEVSALSQNELTDLRLHEIGFIFQDYNLIPTFSVMENIEYVLWLQKVPEIERRKRTKAVCEKFQMGTMMDRYPYQLSRGQQQRVAVARAIVHKPKVVLGDELTANLDHKTGELLMEFLKQLNESEKMTLLYATHDPVMMKFADRIIRLEDGRVVSERYAMDHL